MPATRNEATPHVKPPKVTPFAELTRGTAIATSRGRSRTVADGWTVADVNAMSSEDTLKTQTPRVKREPLLRIREKQFWYDITINRQQIRELQPPNLTGNEVYHMGLPIIWYRILYTSKYRTCYFGREKKHLVLLTFPVCGWYPTCMIVLKFILGDTQITPGFSFTPWLCYHVWEQPHKLHFLIPYSAYQADHFSCFDRMSVECWLVDDSPKQQYI